MENFQGILTERGDVVVLNGVKYRRKMRWYELNLVRGAVAATVAQGTILIDPGTAPFVLTSLHADDTGDGLVLNSQEPWTVQIQDNENGFLWTDQPAPRAAVFGDRILGYQPPDMTAIRANTRLVVSITNRAAPVAGTATISLRGWTLIAL